MGHRVDILSTQPSYKPEAGIPRQPRTEDIDGSTVRRISMAPDRDSSPQKLVNAIYFPLTVFLRIAFGRKYDVVMCSTAPPVLLGVAASLAASLRGSRFIYHCMDIHPEIGAISGEFRHRLVFAALRRLDMGTCRRATAIVVLSEDMRAALASRDPEVVGRVVVLNNFELPDFTPAESLVENPGQTYGASGRIRLVFTGNLGRFQGLESVIEALMCDDDRLDAIELVFMGDGAAKASIRNMIGDDSRFSLLPHGSGSEARALMSTADVGLVSLTPGIISYAYPSKTATYLSQGLPLLVAVEAHSELARTVIDNGVGFVAPPDDATAMREQLLHLVERRDELATMKVQALQTWEKDFGQDGLLKRWENLLEGVCQDGVPGR